MKRWSFLFIITQTVSCGLEEPDAAPRCGPAAGGDAAGTRAIDSDVLLVFGTAGDFSSSSVDALRQSNLSENDEDRVVATGDAALRRLGDQAVVLNRGAASNLQVIDGSLSRGAQVSLDVCNPHDVELIGGCTALVTCYDLVTLKLVDLDAGVASEGPSVADLVLDEDGVPEMDQMAIVGERLYVTLQHLDRSSFYEPVANATLVIFDVATLERLLAVELPCTNPYTDIAVLPDGNLVLACAGDFVTAEAQRLVHFDTSTNEASVLVDGTVIAGSPSAVAAGPDGSVYTLVSVPDAFSAEAMRLVRYDGESAEVLYEQDGYSLAGLATTSEGAVFVGDRSFGESAGLYRIVDDELDGPFATSLPPYEILTF